MAKNMSGKITNPGATIGQAVGNLMEHEIHTLISDIAEKKGYKFANLHLSGKGKLLMYSSKNVEYNIDGVVYDKDKFPIILLESKYIRYKKHNRDKASWIAATYYNVSRNYGSVRGMLAVLAGNWSKGSLSLLENAGITIIRVEFSKIVEILRDYGVNFDWAEDDRESAAAAWEAFDKLTAEQKQKIGERIIEDVKQNIVNYIEKTIEEDKQDSVSEIKYTLTARKKGFAAVDLVENASKEEVLNIIDNVQEIEKNFEGNMTNLDYKPKKIEAL